MQCQEMELEMRTHEGDDGRTWSTTVESPCNRRGNLIGDEVLCNKHAAIVSNEQFALA